MKRLAVILIGGMVAAGLTPALAQETKPEPPPSSSAVIAPDEPTSTSVTPVEPPVKERPPVDLQISEIRYEGGDGDAVVDPGERLNVWVTLSNYGSQTAKSIRATLKIDNAKVSVVEGATTWHDIVSDGHEVAAAPLVIAVAADAERSAGCDVSGGIEPVEGSGSGGTSTAGSGATVVADDATADEPATTEPGAAQPSEPGSEPVRQPDEQPATPEESPVAFEATLVLESATTKTETGFGTQVYCALDMGRPDGTGGLAVDDTASQAPRASGAERLAAAKNAGDRRSAASLAWVLLAAAASLVMRAVSMRRAPTGMR